jgi:hypothetical protein
VDGPLDRRTLLGALCGAGAASFAGCAAFKSDGAATTALPDEARRLAERFAPTLVLDADERWFPTDPRRYESTRDGGTVVTGFDALDGYVSLFEPDAPPDPTLFYNVVGYRDPPLAVVQYWTYSVFDQFTTNFHWHDWEVLHVFVDRETDEPQLYVASSHSRRVPNNEFLDPETEPPRVLSELGSHSSALLLSDEPNRFQRLAREGSSADITNDPLESVEDLARFPFAYGLPRDEGSRPPYAVPELDGVLLYDHPDLPAVGRSDLIPEALTVRSLDALASPPDLPARSTGLTFGHGTGDVESDLVPTSELEHVEAFTGEQLSFEFAVPAFAEDAVASHFTPTSPPWTQPRYEDPTADVSDPGHRAALAARYDAVDAPAPALGATLYATVTRAVTSDDAPDGEVFALLESDPVAVPSTNGVVALRGVPVGEHRLTLNGAGIAPYGERVTVGDDRVGADDVGATDTPTVSGDGDGDVSGEGEGETPTAPTATAAGVEGEIPLVAREDAMKLEVDAEGPTATSLPSPSRTTSPGGSTTRRSPVPTPSTSTAAGPTRRRSGTATVGRTSAERAARSWTGSPVRSKPSRGRRDGRPSAPRRATVAGRTSDSTPSPAC